MIASAQLCGGVFSVFLNGCMPQKPVCLFVKQGRSAKYEIWKTDRIASADRAAHCLYCGTDRAAGVCGARGNHSGTYLAGKSDSPDVSDYQIPRKKEMVIQEEAEEESPDEIEDHDPPQMIAVEPDAMPQEQESFPADSSQNHNPEVSLHVHAYEAETVEASCTEGGYTRYRCACGDSYTGDMVPPLGHAYQETVIAPTAEAEGDTLHTCSRSFLKN